MADPCWIVKRADGYYLSGSHGFLQGLHNAYRFNVSLGYCSPREWAKSCADSWNAQAKGPDRRNRARVVKLVKKPRTAQPSSNTQETKK